MKETFAGPVVGELFTQVANDLAAQHEGEFKDLTVEQRLETLQELLADEGFIVEWEKQGQNYLIHEITCPYLQIGQSHPEVCTVDQTLISRMLAVPAEKVECILSGSTHCTYVVNFSKNLQN